MALFSKDKVEKKLGSSFPFMEQAIGGDALYLNYDTMEVAHKDGTITTTFKLDGIPLYAYTYEAEGDYTVHFNDLSGKVKIRID